MLEITVYPQLTGTARYATMRVMSTTLRTFQLIPQHLEGAGEPPGMRNFLKVLSPVLYFWCNLACNAMVTQFLETVVYSRMDANLNLERFRSIVGNFFSIEWLQLVLQPPNSDPTIYSINQ